MPPLTPYIGGQPVPEALARVAANPPAPTPTHAPRADRAPTPAPRGTSALPEDPALSLFADRKREMGEAAAGAFALIDRPPDAFLWWPWEALHTLTNSIPPEELWIVAGMSGAGKTTLLMSVLDAWLDSGLSVMYVGLEMPPKMLLLHLACRRLARHGVILHPGDVLKGKLHQRHPERLSDADLLTEVLRTEVDYIRTALAERCRFVPVSWLTATNAARICEQAAAWGVQALIYDHLDHLDADGQPMSDYTAHALVLKVLHAACKKYGVTILGAAQMNTDAIKKPGALVRSYTRPSTDMVQYGMLKRRICDILLIAHKMLPPMPERADELDAYHSAMKLVRDDPAMIDRYLVPNTMCITLDKDRAYGHDGRHALLGVRHSRVTDHNPEDLELASRRLLSLARPKTMPAVSAPTPRPALAPARHAVVPVGNSTIALEGFYDED